MDKPSVASANSKHVHLVFNIDARGRYSKTFDSINADGRTCDNDDIVDESSSSCDWNSPLDMS